MHECIFSFVPIRNTGDFGLGGTLPREIGFLSNLSWMNLGTYVSNFHSFLIVLDQ
jgi:hypothetical protein